MPQTAKNHHYMFIGGLWSSLAPDFFLPAKKRFAQLGLTHSQAPIDTSEGVSHNADHLKEILEATHRLHPDKSFVLIGHSKGPTTFPSSLALSQVLSLLSGGVDGLAALLKHPHLQEMTHYLVTMQSPLGGSYLAEDYLASSAALRTWVDSNLIRRISKDYSCLKDLTYAKRRLFFEDYGPIHTKLATPMLNVATYITGTVNRHQSRTKYNRLTICR